MLDSRLGIFAHCDTKTESRKKKQHGTREEIALIHGLIDTCAVVIRCSKVHRSVFMKRANEQHCAHYKPA